MDKKQIAQELDALQEQILFPSSMIEDDAAQATSQMRAKESQRRFGDRSPKQVYDALAKGFKDTFMTLPADASQKIYLRQGTPRQYVDTTLKINDDRPLTKTHDITLNGMYVHGKQGAGTAKKVLSNLTGLLRTEFSNVDCVHVEAKFNGTYAWARFGFAPYRISTELRQNWMAAKQAILDQLTPEEDQAIDLVLTSKDPRSIWQLADMGRTVSDPTTHEATTIGKHLLGSSRWEGFLDLRDPKATARLDGYLAKLNVAKEPKISPDNAQGRA